MASVPIEYCCSCEYRASTPSFKVERTIDGTYLCNGEELYLSIDIYVFNRTPKLCENCYSRHIRQLDVPVDTCNICGRRNKLTCSLHRSQRTGSLWLGKERCVMYKGQVTNGRVCDECRHNNCRLVMAQEELERLYAKFSADLPTPISLHDQVASVPQPPPASTAVGTDVPPRITKCLPLGDFRQLTDLLTETEAAKSQTDVMLNSIQYFLKWKNQARTLLVSMNGGAMDNSSKFEVADFIAMQECFAQMLESQLEAIRADQREIAAEMTRMLEEQTTALSQRKIN